MGVDLSCSNVDLRADPMGSTKLLVSLPLFKRERQSFKNDTKDENGKSHRKSHKFRN